MQWCLASFLFSLVATASWTAQLLVGGDVVFAVVSNVAFAMDVLLVPLIAQTYLVESHPMTYATTIVSALLASASFAHHLDRAQGPAHTLDIAMAWVMYLHLSTFVVYTLLRRLVSWPRLLLVATLVESVGIVAIFSSYRAVYGNQGVFLVVCGAVAHGGTFVHHIVVSGRAGLLSASLNAAALVTLQAVATTLQGEIWYRAASPQRYNIEHGYWHLLNGTIIGVVVMQTTQLIRDKAPSMTAPNERVCCTALVCFSVALVAVTLLNRGDDVTYAAVIPAQLALLLVPGATLGRVWPRRRGVPEVVGVERADDSRV